MIPKIATKTDILFIQFAGIGCRPDTGHAAFANSFGHLPWGGRKYRRRPALSISLPLTLNRQQKFSM
jgi:hypothetical protein